ncbi:MAG: FeoB-associated Cys-rich membrane protein [Oscillospiraceae bacterium]|nr:FeoB-associated Cys-rich membrane protein [Oscillospiraceae bacterium]
MTNLILIAVIAAIVGGASAYIYKEKKKGVRCVGCSFAGQCGKQGSCGCHEEK